MKYKILIFDKNEKISFTKKELEELLNEVYNDGYLECFKNSIYCYSTAHTEPYNPIYY